MNLFAGLVAGLGPHAVFILAAYGITAVSLGALMVWIALDYRVQRRRVRELEERVRKR
jgi:heme exporter protein D